MFWSALIGAFALFAAGSTVAMVSYLGQDDPGRTVRGYFAAVARGDAEAALGYGELPSGSHALLTREVLSVQRRIASISHVSAQPVNRTGQTARMAVRYRLGFRAGSVAVSDEVTLVHHGRSWRLAIAAVPVTLGLARAEHRASIAGGAVPAGDVVMFPGAMPITFDTANLVLGDQSRVVRFAASGFMAISVGVSSAGRSAATAAVDSALARCLAAATSDDPRCPLPGDPRGVPGSLRGKATSRAATAATVSVGTGPDGLLEVAGWITVAGRYAKLDFNNVPVITSDTQTVKFTAHCYATAPGTIEWSSS
ncbi:MAG: hypothetical protein ABJB98_06930 [Actinomycetota bacterium]